MDLAAVTVHTSTPSGHMIHSQSTEFGNARSKHVTAGQCCYEVGTDEYWYEGSLNRGGIIVPLDWDCEG
jgi:hypothetical protein